MCKTFSNVFHAKQKLPARDMTRPCAKLICGSDQAREPFLEVSKLELLQSDVIRSLALLLRYGTMNKAHTVTCFPSPAFGGSRSARWSTSASNFNHWVCQNCATRRCPQSNLWFQTSCFQSKCGTNSKLCIVGYPIIPVIIAPTIYCVDHS